MHLFWGEGQGVTPCPPPSPLPTRISRGDPLGRPFYLVPKLLLGNPLGRKAPLCKIIRWEYYPITIEVPKQSLGQNFVPKQELGNEENWA